MYMYKYRYIKIKIPNFFFVIRNISPPLFMALETDNIKYDEEYFMNSRGLKLFTCKWVPINQEPKALIFFCHGYAMECSITMKCCAIRLVKSGFEVHGIDYEGHGKSEGLSVFIKNFDDLVDDCSQYFTQVCEKEENRGKMRFLLGESMGGAVCLLLLRKMHGFWDGAVLAAPMCKIADDIRPPPALMSFLQTLCNIIPTWKSIISQDLTDIAFKDPTIREEIKANKYCYKGRPRLKTGHELIRVSADIEGRLQEVIIPFLVLHGEEDKVIDKSASKQLYQVASSPDKTFKLYPGMWHGLLFGEPPNNTDIVFADIIEWLEERVMKGSQRSQDENVPKQKLDNML